jgi:hypothetical protein
MDLKSIASIRVRQQCFLACILLVLAGGVACQKTTSGQSQATEKKADIPVLKTEDDVKNFITENLQKPIPPGYKIPSYITSELPLEQVYDTLEVRYPTFYGKRGKDYLQAVMADPATYLKMNVESKAIRRYYDPNSKY